MIDLNLYQSPAIITAWVIGLLGVFGNGSLIVIGIKYWHAKVTDCRSRFRNKKISTVKLLVYNLVVVDLMGAFYLLIIAFANTIYNVQILKPQNLSLSDYMGNSSSDGVFINLWIINPMCSIARFFYFLSQTMSILLTLLIAIERYLVLVRSIKLSKSNLIRVKIALVLCWLLCIAKALYPVIRGLIILPLVRHQKRSNSMLCLLADINIQNIRILNIINLSIFYGCYFLTISIYITMLIRLHQVRNLVQYYSVRPEIAIAKTMICITFCNFASMVPITVIIMCRMMALRIIRSPEFIEAGAICIIFIFASSVSNPLIHLKVNSITNRKRHQIIHCR